MYLAQNLDLPGRKEPFSLIHQRSVTTSHWIILLHPLVSPENGLIKQKIRCNLAEYMWSRATTPALSGVGCFNGSFDVRRRALGHDACTRRKPCLFLLGLRDNQVSQLYQITSRLLLTWLIDLTHKEGSTNPGKWICHSQILLPSLLPSLLFSSSSSTPVQGSVLNLSLVTYLYVFSQNSFCLDQVPATW